MFICDQKIIEFNPPPYEMTQPWSHYWTWIPKGLHFYAVGILFMNDSHKFINFMNLQPTLSFIKSHSSSVEIEIK